MAAEQRRGPKRPASQSAEEGGSQRKKRKQYMTSVRPLVGHDTKGKLEEWRYGLSGVFMTCDPKRMGLAVREARGLIAEFDVDQADSAAAANAAEQNSDTERERLVDETLEAELQALQSRKTVRFRNLDTGLKGTFFFQSPPDVDVLAFVRGIHERRASTRLSNTPHIHLVAPVLYTCFASTEEIARRMRPLVEAAMPVLAPGTAPVPYSVVLKRRANNTLDRDATVAAVAALVPPSCYVVDIRRAELALLVEVVCGVAALSVLPGYRRYRAYNVQMVCASGLGEDAGADVPGADAEAAGQALEQ